MVEKVDTYIGKLEEKAGGTKGKRPPVATVVALSGTPERLWQQSTGDYSTETPEKENILPWATKYPKQATKALHEM